MKKLFLIAILLIIPILLLGCTAEDGQTGNVEAAESNVKSTELPDFPLKYCPVTQQPQEPFIPPEPFKQEPYPGQFFYGTADLWTALPTDHTWHSLPYDPEHGYGQKLFFQRDGYDWIEEPLPALTVTGRRIDLESSGDSVTMTATDATNGYTPEDNSFMLAGGHFPTAGCWEITGHYGDDSLTYVIWIASGPHGEEQ